MTAEGEPNSTPRGNAFDVISATLTAQAQAFAVLVHMLELHGALPKGVVRQGIDLLIEKADNPDDQRVRHLKDILLQLPLQPPVPDPGRP